MISYVVEGEIFQMDFFFVCVCVCFFFAGVHNQATASSAEERSMRQSRSSEITTDIPSLSLSEKSSVFYNIRLLIKTILLYLSSLGRIPIQIFPGLDVPHSIGPQKDTL